MTFIGNDANGTDGSNLALMSALYKLAGQLYRIPADTAPENVMAALASASGLSISDIQTIDDVQANFAANLTTIQSNASAAGAEHAALPGTLTLPQIRNIIEPMLLREAALLAIVEVLWKRVEMLTRNE